MPTVDAFKELIQRSAILKAPGVHDPLTARLADAVGFDAIYMTGWGTTVAKTGYPDVGIATLSEMTHNASLVTQHVDVPVFADADDGYGNPLNVVRTVREYAQSGVAGIHVEDARGPKSAGAVRGKELIPFDEAVAKYRAAVETRDDLDGDLVVIARTDAPIADDGSIKEAIQRGNAAADEGVDVVFVVGQSTEDSVREVGAEIDAPLLYDCGGGQPHLDAAALEEYGYDVVIYPTLATLSTIREVSARMRDLSERGADAVTAVEEDLTADGVDVDSLTGLEEAREWERRYVGEE
jgi:2-methylisocitrate lyase-like PEP mutase family enzyme